MIFSLIFAKMIKSLKSMEALLSKIFLIDRHNFSINDDLDGNCENLT